MKALFTSLFAVTLLASCSHSPNLTPQQQAVSAYLQKSLDDPASYQPVHWSPAQPWRKVDAAKAALAPTHLQATEDSLAVSDEYQVFQATSSLGKTSPSFAAQIAGDKAKWEQAVAKNTATHKRLDSLRAVTDTTRIGYLLTHAFRAKNKLGAVVLDSARFEVQANGQVRVWNPAKG
jgi:hypothetical protein